MNNPIITAASPIPAYACVKVSTSGSERVEVATSAADVVFGVTLAANTPAGGVVDFQTTDSQLDIFTLKAAGTIAIGQYVVPTTNGTVAASTTGPFVALDSANIGETFTARKFNAGATANFLAPGTGATTRTLDSKLADIISVKDFGAVGDGTTDDTVAIQAALTAAGVSGGSVYIPTTNNSYKITDKLTVPDKVSVFGDGYGSCIQQFTAERNLLVCGNSSVVRNLRLKMPSGFPLSDLIVQNAVYIYQKSGVTVRNNFIELVDAQSGVNAFQSRNVIISENIIYGGNWNPATSGTPAAGMADILIYGSDPTVALQLSRYTVTNNFCFSNNSQGIYVDQLGSNTETIIQGNQCVTLDPSTCTIGGTWLEIASGSLTRRHGIVLGYNCNTVNGPRSIIANNITRNTNLTGLYIQVGGNGTSNLLPGPVLVTGNLCSKNGLDIANVSGVVGGIFFANCNSNTVITGNVIDEFQNPSYGGINYTTGEVTSASTGPTISNNYILSSLGHGIYLTNLAANVNVVGNTIVGTVKNDIHHAAGAGQSLVGGMLIEGNTLKRTNFNFESIWLDAQDGTVVSTVRNNYFKGHDKTTGGSSTATVLIKNAGVKTNRNAYIRVTGNIFDNFHVAVSITGYWTASTRHFNADFSNNTVRNCITGFGLASIGNGATAAVVPVCENIFEGVTNNISASDNASPGGFLCGYIARKDNNRLVVLDVNATPTVATWAVGDRAEYTTPTAGGFLGAVCTTAGAPGTWKTFGAVTA